MNNALCSGSTTLGIVPGRDGRAQGFNSKKKIMSWFKWFDNEPGEIWTPGLSEEQKDAIRLGENAIFNFAKQYGCEPDEVSLTFEPDAGGNLVPVVRYDPL